MLLNLALLVLLAGEVSVYAIDYTHPRGINIGCNETVYVKPGENAYFRSPNFDGHTHYNNNDHCNAVLTTQEYPLKFVLHALHFNVDYQEICGYDSLCIKGVKFCGSWITDKYFFYEVPAYNQLTLRFTTDTSVTKPGFEFRIQTSISRVKPGEYVSEIAYGVGSGPGKMGYFRRTLDDYEDTECGSQPLGMPANFWAMYGITTDNYIITKDYRTTEDYDQGTTDGHTTTDSYSTRDWVTGGYPYQKHYYAQTTQDYDYSTRDRTTGSYPYYQSYNGQTTQDYDCPCRCGTTYNPYYG